MIIFHFALLHKAGKMKKAPDSLNHSFLEWFWAKKNLLKWAELYCLWNQFGNQAVIAPQNSALDPWLCVAAF